MQARDTARCLSGRRAPHITEFDNTAASSRATRKQKEGPEAPFNHGTKPAVGYFLPLAFFGSSTSPSPFSTNSIIAISAASPRRGPSLMIRV